MTATTVRVPERPRAGEELRNNLLMILVIAVALILAWVLMSLVESRMAAYNAPDGSRAVKYPAGWVLAAASDPDTLLEVYDAKAASTYHPTFRVQRRAAPQGQSLLDAATAQSLRRRGALREYQELRTEEATVAGQRAIRVNYGYVADPPAGAGLATLPVVVEATDLLVMRDGQLLVFTMASEAGSAEAYQRVFGRILRSIRLK